MHYVKAHEHKGDAVIAVGPANLTGGSLGRAPTYWLSANRTQTLLYVFEKNNQVVDTQYGVAVLLNVDGIRNCHRRPPSDLVGGSRPERRAASSPA